MQLPNRTLLDMKKRTSLQNKLDKLSKIEMPISDDDEITKAYMHEFEEGK